MTSVADTATTTAPAVDALDDGRYIGLVTRAVSWIMDALVINLVAIITALGIALVLSIFPLSGKLKPALEAAAGVSYILWAAAYFIAFWSITGQTPGARIMQIRLITRQGGKLKPRRALLRWIAMNLAMVPLFAGYYPILFRRRGFPDWIARTRVIDAPQTSLVDTRRQQLTAARDLGGGAEPPAPRPPRPGRGSR